VFPAVRVGRKIQKEAIILKEGRKIKESILERGQRVVFSDKKS